jgi:hypothetical protein
MNRGSNFTLINPFLTEQVFLTQMINSDNGNVFLATYAVTQHLKYHKHASRINITLME